MPTAKRRCLHPSISSSFSKPSGVTGWVGMLGVPSNPLRYQAVPDGMGVISDPQQIRVIPLGSEGLELALPGRSEQP